MTIHEEQYGSPPCQMDEADAMNPDYTQLGNKPACLDFPLANTILYCRHWEQTRHFYRHILRLTAVFSKDDWFIEFRVNDTTHLSIADAERCSVEAGQGRGLTLSFMTPDLKSLHGHFCAENQQPGTIVDKGWREPYFYLYDPENNRIEFWQPRSRRET